MFDELKKVSTAVKGLLAADPFAKQLSPASLQKGTEAYPIRGGKMLRPSLLMWSCGLFGEASPALPVAAAVELFHTWTLVHDDIIDDDDTRRGGLSVHKLVEADTQVYGADIARTFGTNMAILAGDVQQAWANSLIINADLQAEIRLAILDRLNSWVNPQLISGEAMDVEFEHRPFESISVEEMEKMLRLKTALLLRFAAETGAMIGCNTTNPNDARVQALGDFAEDIGFAFQLRDDLLGMFGNEDKLGKPVGSDLIQSKRNFLFAISYKLMDADAQNRFLELLGSDLGQEAVDEGAALINASGRQATEDLIRSIFENGQLRLESLPKHPNIDLLKAWSEFACYREF